jgi:hypothetical protein
VDAQQTERFNDIEDTHYIANALHNINLLNSHITNFYDYLTKIEKLLFQKI